MKLKRAGFLGAIGGIVAAVLTASPFRAASAPAKPQLKVWWDGDHWVVAANPEDATQVLSDFGGDHGEEQKEYYDLHAWEEWTATVPDIRHDEIEIGGLTVVGGVISGPPEAWVATGRGLIGSAECCNAN